MNNQMVGLGILKVNVETITRLKVLHSGDRK